MASMELTATFPAGIRALVQVVSKAAIVQKNSVTLLKDVKQIKVR